MLKWIASGCLVIIVVIGIVMYAGYRKMQSIAAAGPSVSVGIQATPERVFAAMTHTDSLASWFAPTSKVTTARKGMLAAGDTLFLTTRRDSIPRSAWVVDSVVPNKLMTMRWVMLQNGMVVTRRRDSLSVVGDSTIVTSTVSSFMSDSLSAARNRSSGVTGGMLEMGSTMSVAGARLQAEMELNRLKDHIQGRPVSRP
jgi:uncharacterized protein YndB with AHSA1/START domain